jgi:hypothetical protein
MKCVTPCSSIEVYKRFRATYCLHLQCGRVYVTGRRAIHGTVAVQFVILY